MKKWAILLCLLATFALGYTDFDTKTKNRLCELYQEQELAKFYGQYRELENIQKRIDSYKFKFGIGNEFDSSQCDFGRGYYLSPYYDSHDRDYDRQRRDSYNDGYYDGYKRGRQDRRYDERGYDPRRGY